MDTHSKAGSYLPVLGAILGGVGLIVGIVGTVTANDAKKQLAEVQQNLEARISDSENSINSARSSAEQARTTATQTAQRLDSVIQQTMKAFEDVSSQFTAVRNDMTKLASAAPARNSGGATGGQPTIKPGVLQPDGTYAIKAGDTFSKLAREFNISVADLQKANPGVDSSKLKVGQKIKVPGAKPQAEPAAPAPRST